MTGRTGTRKPWVQSRPLEAGREMRTQCADTHQGQSRFIDSSIGRIQACSQTFLSRIVFLQNGGSPYKALINSSLHPEGVNEEHSNEAIFKSLIL